MKTNYLTDLAKDVLDYNKSTTDFGVATSKRIKNLEKVRNLINEEMGRLEVLHKELTSLALDDRGGISVASTSNTKGLDPLGEFEDSLSNGLGSVLDKEFAGSKG